MSRESKKEPIQPRQQHVLIVEDEIKLSQVLAEYLQHAGYNTDCLHRGDEVMSWLVGQQTDLIVLDLMLPGLDGMSLCEQIRQFSQTPILMATAKIDEIDRFSGLESGADDYVCKPYSMREMVARVAAILRRSGGTPRLSAPALSEISINLSKMEISVKGQLLDLTAVEFRLLNHLLSHPQVIFSRDDLLNVIYDDYRFVSNRTIDSHIKNVRKKIQPYFDDHEIIRSIYSVGYKFEPIEKTT